MNELWRIVHSMRRGDAEVVVDVNTVVLTADELPDSFDAEEWLHTAAGWTVTRGDMVLVCRREAGPSPMDGSPLPSLERIITARAYDPALDGEPLEVGGGQ